MATVLTRRGLIAAAPTAVVTASLPLRVAGVPAEAQPDAELSTLFEGFKRLHAEWQDLLDRADKLEPEWKERFASTAGTDDDFWRCGRESGYDEAVGSAEAKVQELDVIANRMREIPAQTITGFAIKARLTQFDVNLSRRSEMTAPERDWDWDVRCMEHFVREIERFADLVAMGGAHA